ncbi:MAG TPA: glutamine-hydrolyzing GMP synthase [Bacillota bacterium]
MTDRGPRELVAVIDFGAQYNQLIARRVRELGVYSEVVPAWTPLDELLARKPKAIILSGGPASVYEDGAPRYDPRLFDSGLPILGICYGMQLMAFLLGGRVTGAERREYGHVTATVDTGAAIFKGLEPAIDVWMSHGVVVQSVPPGFSVIARSENTPVAAMAAPDRRMYAVQFHPEVVHTPKGLDILRAFLFNVAGCAGDWGPSSFIERAVADVRAIVGPGHVLCALSGGVDSSVVAALVQRAVGDRLTCLFVDNGLLRLDEAAQVRETFGGHFGMNLVHADASDRFLGRLAGVTDPERKRKIIGEEFIRVFEAEAAKLAGAGKVEFLAQGTIYPDVIESGGAPGGGPASVIKSHHNVGGLPSDLQFKLVEPLRYLFKDEVRRVGFELGLPSELVWRHPFPGPGLAVRVLGEVTRERLETVRQADAIVIEEVRRAGWYDRLLQVFAVLLPVRSVGVMGDERTYGCTVVLRAITGQDFMTVDWARLPYELIERISSRVVNEVKGVNRLVYDVTTKPPATVEWE